MKPSPVALTACLAVSSLAGCGPGDGEVTFDDTRIDGGEAWDPEPRSHDPRLCASGAWVYAAWWDDREGTDNVWLSASADAGASWPSAPARVNQNPQQQYRARRPEIACHENEVFVVWEDDRASDIENPGIYYNFSQDGGLTWQSDDIPLAANDGDFASLAPRISLSCAGTDPVVCAHVSVVWYDGRNGAYDIYYNHSANYGFNWMQSGEARVDVGAEDAHSGKPRMATDGAGGVFVAWEDRRGGTTDIYLNRSTDWGQTWASPDTRIDLDEGAAPADSFVNDLAVEAGRLYVVWSDRRNGEFQDAYIAVSADSGATFSPPLRLDVGDGPGVSNSLYPVVRASGLDVWVVFRDARLGNYDVLLQHSADGGVTFLAEPVRLDHDTTNAHTLDPVLLLDVPPTDPAAPPPTPPAPTLAVAWPDLRDGYDDLYYVASLDGGATWAADDTRIDADQAGTAISESLQAALSDGVLYFLWLDWRFGEADVFFRKFTLTR